MRPSDKNPEPKLRVPDKSDQNSHGYFSIGIESQQQENPDLNDNDYNYT